MSAWQIFNLSPSIFIIVMINFYKRLIALELVVFDEIPV
jgi:hypothetical protein